MQIPHRDVKRAVSYSSGMLCDIEEMLGVGVYLAFILQG
jgi:hypothetical protein